jgi:hypothetical protein
MKKLLLAAFSIFISLQLRAQVEVPALLIFEDSTLSVNLLLPVFSGTSIDYAQLQSEITYRSDGHEATLVPGILKEVRFGYNGELVRMVSMMHMGSKTRVESAFMKVAVEGPVNVYEFFTYANNQISGSSGRGGTVYVANANPKGYPRFTSEYIFQKKGKELKWGSLNFRKDMSEYFNDCPVLSDLIYYGDFKREDLVQIAVYYNTKCGR